MVGSRKRWLTQLSRVTIGHPGWVLSMVLLVILIAAALVPGIGVTTSRYGLVSSDNPYQARLFAFFKRFGYPDTPVLVLTGGTAPQRRQLVDLLERRLEKEPMFTGRVMARIDPEKVAEILLVHQPAALSALRPFLGPNRDLADVIEGGLPAMTQVMQSQIEAVAAADQLRMMAPYPLGPAGDATVEAITWLGALANALDAALAGEPAWPGIMEPAGNELLPADQGMDARGYLVGRGGNHHIIAIFAQLPGDRVEQLRPIVDRIRSIRDQVLAETGVDAVKIRLTGLPALSVDEQKVITRGLMQSSAAAAAAILCLFLLVFRSFRQTVMALLPLLVGVVMTLAAAHLIFGQLNIITSAFIAILLGLGIDFAVHATARYNEALRGGATPALAVEQTLVLAGPGILTGAATTAIAFLTTVLSEFTAFAELGILTALGLVFTLLATFFLVPPLLVWGTRQRMPVSPELPGMAWLGRISRKVPVPILVIAATAAVAGGIALPRISFNVRYFDFLPSRTESAIALGQLEADGIMGPTFAFLSADNVEQARTMTQELRKLPTVAAVHSATDLMPHLSSNDIAHLRESLSTSRPPDFSRMAQKPVSAREMSGLITQTLATLGRLHSFRILSGRPTEPVDRATEALTRLRDRLDSLPDDGKGALRQTSARTAALLERAWRTAQTVSQRGYWLPSDLPDVFRARFASKDGKGLAIFVYPTVNVWDLNQAMQFRQELETVDPNASGTAINLHEHSRMVLRGFERAAIVAAVLIFLILLLDFRNLVDVLLALAPLVCGWLWMLGAMGAFKIPFDFANIVALPLVPGIGVTAGVHLMHRCRQSAQENGGVARIEDLMRGTGAAVVVAAVTTVFGFAGLMVADYGGMISLGLVMSLGVSSCLLGAVHVLPAILLVLGRAR